MVPEELAKAQIDAVTDMEAALRRRDELIVEALKAGCSTRQVAAVADMTHSRIQQIGRENGWPPADVAERRRLERERQSAERKHWDEIIRQAREVRGLPTD